MMRAEFVNVVYETNGSSNKDEGCYHFYQQIQWTAAELINLKFPPIKYVVDDLIPEGLSILAGKPKIGKSYLVLDICLAVALGGTALGSINCEQGNVLYLALEDNSRRLQKRLRQILPSPSQGNTDLENLQIWTEVKKMNDDGLHDVLEWIAKVENPRLIVIDTFGRVRPAQKGGGYDYLQDYQFMEPLHQLANREGLAILGIHHLRKSEADDPIDMISGSTGFTGAADSLYILKRDSNGTTLYGRGRDIEEFEKAVSFDQISGQWTILGDADEVRKSETRKKILSCLREDHPLGPTKISEQTDLTESNVKKTLLRMVADGDLKKDERGKYSPA